MSLTALPILAMRKIASYLEKMRKIASDLEKTRKIASYLDFSMLFSLPTSNSSMTHLKPKEQIIEEETFSVESQIYLGGDLTHQPFPEHVIDVDMEAPQGVLDIRYFDDFMIGVMEWLGSTWESFSVLPQ